MKNNELSTMEKLDVAIQSHKFYSGQCVDLEKQINIKIDSIFQTEETGKNISKKDIKETVALVSKLLTLSSKYISEGENVLAQLEKHHPPLTEDFAEAMKNQLTSLNKKQESIHERVTEIQQMLFEMYNVDIDEEDTF